jgi:hypothetical protein
MKKIGFILLMSGHFTTFCSDKTVIIPQPHPAQIAAAVAVSHADSKAAHKAAKKLKKQGKRFGKHLKKGKF